MNQPLEQSIVQTLAYFSVASFPLTREEVYRYVWKAKASWDDVGSELVSMVTAKKIGEKWGYYFLLGEESFVEERRAAAVWSDIKIGLAKRTVRYLSWIPFLQAVVVCNSVGREVAAKESDIDVLIITAPRRLWIVRACANAVLRLFGLRTYKNKERDRVCLSFFVASDTLDVAPYRAVTEDIHFAYWLHQMVPIYDPQGLYQKMLRANLWTNDLLPRRKQNISATETPTNFFSTLIKRFFEIAWGGMYGDLVQKQSKDIQMMLLKKKVALANKPDNGLVIKDNIVKMHEHDARVAYREAWFAKQKKYV